MTRPLDPHDHAGRRQRLAHAVEAAQAAAIYVTSASNVAYLTGFTGSNGQVVITAGGDAHLLTDPRYTGRAAIESPDVEVVITRTPHAVALDLTEGRLYFEGKHLIYADALDLLSESGQRQRDVVSANGMVEQLRMHKEASEIQRLEAACQITVRAWELTIQLVKPGITEREIAQSIERTIVDLGADGIAFDSIVASGRNGAIPHHEPSDRPMQAGDLITMDVGALVDGYHADMTRTVALGPPSDELRGLHDLVRAAQWAGVEAAVAGASCGDVDAASRDIIAAAGHGEHFVHGIGHGVGLDIHEAPILTTVPTASLEPSFAITVEPGVYLPDVGGVRIEDTIVVTNGAAQILTDAPRDLIVV